MTESFEQWVDLQYLRAVPAMLQSVSAVDIVKTRPGFGQTVRPAKGSIVASPVLAAYDPDPDYFFHWYRDSAVVIDVLRLLFEAGSIGPEALVHLRDFVSFSLALQDVDGRAYVRAPDWRAKVTEDFRKFLRTDQDLASVHEDAVAADTRVNPDGTLDISSWARPQHDGPAMRAVALLRWLRSVPLDAALTDAVTRLVRSDLAFAARHWHEPSYDIWEEERGQHYYTLSVSAAALEEGARWLRTLANEHGHGRQGGSRQGGSRQGGSRQGGSRPEDSQRADSQQADGQQAEGQQAEAQHGYGQQGDEQQAQAYDAIARQIREELDRFWLAGAGYYRSRVLSDGTRSTKELDIAVILAAVHAGSDADTHSVHDPKMQATLERLEQVFDSAYAINRNRPPGRAPAMGRYLGDVYYSGGAYYFSTLGAAEFCFRAAARAADAQAWINRGDAFLATVRAFTPDSGAMSEQFDQHTGRQTSARHLAWSYACFLSTVCARRAVTR